MSAFDHLEAALGWKLPEEYLRYHTDNQYWANFFTPEEALEELSEWSHPASLPLGGDGLGSMYVLKSDGSVHYWDHERPAELSPLDPSFAHFMEEGRRQFALQLEREPRG